MRGEKIQNDLTKRAVRALAQIAAGLRSAPKNPESTSGSGNAGSWLRAEEARKFVFNALVVVLLVLFASVIGKATFKRGIVVEPVSVPKELADRGYTAEVVAQQIIDEINAVVSEAETSRELGSVSMLPSERLMPKVELPGSGISIAAVIYYMRDFFGFYDLKIVGEITHERESDGSLPASPKYLLRIRIAEPFFRYRSPEPSRDLAQLVKAAALPILEPINPYIAGVSYLNKRDFTKAMRMAQLCLRSSTEHDRLWGLNLRGAIAKAQERLDEAHDNYSRAFYQNPNFPLAQYNLATIALSREQYSKAIESSLYALSTDDHRRRRSVGYHNAGVALEQMWRKNIPFESNQDLTLLFDQLFGQPYPVSLQDGPSQEAYPLDRAYSSGIPGATVLALQQGKIPNPQAALVMLRRAVENDPMFLSSYYEIGKIEYERDGGDKKNAELVLETAIALFTERTSANRKALVHHYLGRIRADRGDHESAFVQFDAAIKADPGYAWPHVRWAQALVKGANRTQNAEMEVFHRIEAAANLERAVALKPADPTILNAAAETFEQFDMVDDAIKTYKKIIALGGNDEKTARKKIEQLRPNPSGDRQSTAASGRNTEVVPR